MAKISTEKEVTTTIDADGNETSTTIEKTHKIEVSTEPDYIKLYTAMWCEFNQIPSAYRQLFLELVGRMSYCNKCDLTKSQIVFLGEPISSDICKSLHWTSKDSLMKGLRALIKCGAIKKIARAVYQINPSYAGRGEWKYNPRLNRGGIEDLVATFNFRDKTVTTNIVWADDGECSAFNSMYREGLGVSAKDHAVLVETEISN